MPVQKRKRLSGRLTVAILLGVVLFLIPFYFFGRMDLARPSLFGATAIGCAIATRWKLRNRRWFWIAIAVVTAVHVYIIGRFHWDEEEMSQLVIGAYTLIDYALILVVIWVAEIICRTPEEAESRRGKTQQ
jgi:hypothetical protein